MDEGNAVKIPTSGPGRRRAKALRNMRAALKLDALAGPVMRRELQRERLGF